MTIERAMGAISRPTIYLWHRRHGPMRIACLLTTVVASMLSAGATTATAQSHLNPVIVLLNAKQPVFGLYAPANRRARPGAAAQPADSVKSAEQLAAEAVAYRQSDYIFDGTMEGNFTNGYASFSAFAAGVSKARTQSGAKASLLVAPLFVKTPGIADNPELARERIGKQLDLGVSGIVFVDVESAAELRTGIAAMRFVSNGGTRAESVGQAPARWGMSAADYKEKADVWPLNTTGELVNFAIVESLEGLRKIREIAAVPGIGVLFPGAGTLRGVFTSTDASGQRVLDAVGWEAAIQQVLAACKEFHVACGYPATDADIEMRMKQGFSVFVIGWGPSGFKAVELGRAASGRTH